ncbi:MAG: Gfo/Idh/MocA family oxidoreductase [Clostridiales bacterium]|nr:Gfo/Idh/MocA family oxidoreductase [Clostridiales bacterium]
MKFRVGIIGVGSMGSGHLKNILKHLSNDIQITALCDIVPEQMYRHKELFNDNDVAFFQNSSDLILSGLVDGVIIATPHYFHPDIAIEAFNAGLHVFCEKPAGVYTKQVKEMNKAAKKANKAFQVNFVLRATTPFKKLKEIIDTGKIGTVRRLTWIITTWYRTQSYYNSAGWRATWAGEGGGTLLNQNPHQLDLVQWLVGVPKRIRGFCYFGKRRNIEVEDEATLYMEYDNGLTATYITCVSEFPGTNRLEIAGSKGKAVLENNKVTLYTTAITEDEFNLTTNTAAGPIPMKIEEYAVSSDIELAQVEMVRNWMNSALHGDKLISYGEEGINSLMISNGAYLSSWEESWIDLPFDDDRFLSELNKRIESSVFVKKNVSNIVLDTAGTYTK